MKPSCFYKTVKFQFDHLYSYFSDNLMLLIQYDTNIWCSTFIYTRGSYLFVSCYLPYERCLIFMLINLFRLYWLAPVSNCNASKYMYGKCGGTTRVAVLIGGNFLLYSRDSVPFLAESSAPVQDSFNVHGHELWTSTIPLDVAFPTH